MKARLLHLDGMRGLLCITVVLGHWLGSRLGWGNIHFSNSYIAVDCFFILSGFVLSYVYKNKMFENSINLRQFFFHRLLRLYPLHILTFIMTFVIYYFFVGAFPFKEPFSSAIYNIFLLHGLGVTDSWNWNDPSWSVSVEFFASIIFIPLLLRVKSNITLFIIASFSLCLVLGKHSTLMAATDVNLFLLSSGMLKCLGGMAIGMALFNLVCEGKPDQYFHNKWILNICECTCFIFICFFIYTVKPVRGYDVLVIISMAILIYTTTKYNSMLSTVLGSKIISYFGKISFSIYLIHTPLIVLLSSFKNFNSQNIYLQSFIFALITLLSSHYLYSRFEMPIYSKYRKITDAKFKSSRIITTS